MEFQEKSTWAAEFHGLWMEAESVLCQGTQKQWVLFQFFYKSFQERLPKSRYWVVWFWSLVVSSLRHILWFPVLADNVFVASVIFSQQGYSQTNSENCLYKRDTDELPFLQTVFSQTNFPRGLFYQNMLSQHVRIYQIRKAENSGLWIWPLLI